MIRLELPYPVSTNRYWRTYRGRQVVSAEARAYKSLVAREAALRGLQRPIAGPVAVDIVLHPIAPQDAVRRARREGPLWHLGVRCQDLGNAEKIVGDALNGIAYGDDSQTVQIHLQRGLPVPGGALVVTVALWSPPA